MQFFATVIADVCYRLHAEIRGDTAAGGRNPLQTLTAAPETAAVPAAFGRFLTALATPPPFLHRLYEVLLQRSRDGGDEWPDMVRAALIGPIALAIDTRRGEFSRDAGDGRQIDAISRALSTVGTAGPRDGAQPVCALTGAPARLLSGSFPQPTLPSLGQTYLFSRNADTSALARYGRIGPSSVPVDAELVGRFSDTLTKNTDESRHGKTWRLLPADSGDSQDLLLAFLASDLDVPFADAIAAEDEDGEEETPTARRAGMERVGAQLVQLWQTAARKAPGEHARILLLRTIDKGNRKAVYDRSPSVGALHAAAVEWATAMRNAPSTIRFDRLRARRFVESHPRLQPPLSLIALSRRILPGETDRAHEVIAEHHHRADLDAPGSRDLAVLWRSPIVVTTSVQFFETLAACEPARLRKLHGLAGAVVLLDESHACLPAHLWRQNWAWMRELTRDFGCSFAFASGSLARVWEEADLVGQDAVTHLPHIAPAALAARLNSAEHRRVRYRTVGRIPDILPVIRTVAGPRLVVVNTVRTAAVIANRLRKSGADVLHLSSALCPNDRERILREVRRRLAAGSGYGGDWTLIATSLVEAGVDLSFRTGLRERFSVGSLIQLGGRINRDGGEPVGDVIDFLLDADAEMTVHPGCRESANVLERFWRDGVFSTAFSPAEIVSRALREEASDQAGAAGEALAEAEGARDYPDVARRGRLIDADTALVVVDTLLADRLARRDAVSARDLLGGSVQIWTRRILDLALPPIPGRPGIHAWPHAYDAGFLGYLAGLPDAAGSADQRWPCIIS